VAFPTGIGGDHGNQGFPFGRWPKGTPTWPGRSEPTATDQLLTRVEALLAVIVAGG